MKPLDFRTFCIAVSFAIVSFAGIRPLRAQAPSPSTRVFVTRFYSWYEPLALRDNGEPAWRIALKAKRGYFDQLLARRLQEDSAAQDQCEDLVGLDFDPFLYSQNPAEHYEVGEVRRRGKIYKVEVYRVQAGQRSNKPDVIAGLERKHGRWVFVNFYSPDGGDLRTVLRALRALRDVKDPCEAPRVARKE